MFSPKKDVSPPHVFEYHMYGATSPTSLPLESSFPPTPSAPVAPVVSTEVMRDPLAVLSPTLVISYKAINDCSVAVFLHINIAVSPTIGVLLNLENERLKVALGSDSEDSVTLLTSAGVPVAPFKPVKFENLNFL